MTFDELTHSLPDSPDVHGPADDDDDDVDDGRQPGSACQPVTASFTVKAKFHGSSFFATSS